MMPPPQPRGTAESSAGFACELRTVRVVFRDGAIGDTGNELARMGAARALALCTPGRAGTVNRIRGVENGGRIVRVFDGAREHVPVDLVDHVMRTIEQDPPDSLVAIGGGSAIGLAKAISLRMALPILAVPTTFSGSEMTCVWGTTAAGRKTTGRDDRVAPRVVVYDPELTRGLPYEMATTSGLNAVAHAVEALYAPDANPVSSLFAAEAIRLLASGLRTLARFAEEPSAVAAAARHRPGGRSRSPADPATEPLAAYRDALLGAHLAGRALDMTRMGLHHRLCHSLGGAFGTPHALTHAILLPCVAAFLLPAAPLAAAAIASALGGKDAVAGLYGLRTDLGIHSTLRDLGLEAGELERLAGEVAPTSPEHPRRPAVEDVRAILDAAWHGRQVRFSRTRP